MVQLLRKAPPSRVLTMAGETIARFAEEPGVHPASRSLNGAGPPVYLGGATANIAASVVQLFPRIHVRFVSEVGNDTFGRQAMELARLYGLDPAFLYRSNLPVGSDVLTPFYRMPLAPCPSLPQEAETFCRVHGPVPLWDVSRMDFDGMMSNAGAVFVDGIFPALSNLRRNADSGTVAIAQRMFSIASQRGLVKFFDTNRRASLWRDQEGIGHTVAMYRPFLDSATVVTGSVGLLLPMVGRTEEFDSNDFGKRCIAEIEQAGRSDLLSGLLLRVFEEFSAIEVLGVTIREEVTPGRHRIACAIVVKGGELAISPILDLQIIDRPGMGDAAASIVIGSCFEPDVTLQSVANRMVAAFALAGMTVGDIPSYRGIAQLDKFFPGKVLTVVR